MLPETYVDLIEKTIKRVVAQYAIIDGDEQFYNTVTAELFPERNYFERKLVSGGEYKIIKCAEFGAERTSNLKVLTSLDDAKTFGSPVRNKIVVKFMFEIVTGIL